MATDGSPQAKEEQWARYAQIMFDEVSPAVGDGGREEKAFISEYYGRAFNFVGPGADSDSDSEPPARRARADTVGELCGPHTMSLFDGALTSRNKAFACTHQHCRLVHVAASFLDSTFLRFF
jgi:hypothetical protein